MRVISAFYLIGLLVFASAAVKGEKEFAPDENTLFLAHFNSGFNADSAKGSPQIEKFGEIRQTDGKFGKALTGFYNSKSYIKIPVEKNFNVNFGTIEMWIRPTFDYDKAPENFCTFFYCDADDETTAYENCAYLVYDRISCYFTFCWRAQGKAAFAFSKRQFFKKGDWIHLACLWGGEANTIVIVVDGCVGDSTAEIPGKWKNNPRELIVGNGKNFKSGGKRSAYSDIDEIRIKNTFSYKIYEADKNFEVDGKKYFYCPRNKKADPQLIQQTDTKSPFLIFKRDPRMIYPDSIPQKEELIRDIRVSTTPGEQKAFYFSLYSLQDLVDIKLHASIADESGREIKMDKMIQIKKAQCWPQKTDFATSFYYIIPELLETFNTDALKKNECVTYWIDFKTNENMKAGKYSGMVNIVTGGNSETIDIPIELIVLPFKLAEPDDKYWLMYIDRYPEKNFDQQKKMLELLKSYGISGLILNFAQSPQAFHFETQDGKLKEFRSDYLRDILKIYNDIGMNGPIALWFNTTLEPAVADALKIKEPLFSDAWKNKMEPGLKNAVALINDYMKKCSPRLKWYFYGKDEPKPNSEEYRKTFWIYNIIHKMGINTCLTYYPSYKSNKECSDFLPLLTADIADPSDAKLNLLRQFSQYWLLGGGCYTGQEGGLMPNRFLSGFGFYQTKGEAHVSWIWHRIKNDPFNEFRKSEKYYVQNKNGMIAYPSRNPNDKEQYISTLQWEGIREGITDYKYLYTLYHYIALAKKYNLNDSAEVAEKSLSEILKRIPNVSILDTNGYKTGDYYMAPGNFTDGTANECRTIISDEIVRLMNILDKKAK